MELSNAQWAVVLAALAAALLLGGLVRAWWDRWSRRLQGRREQRAGLEAERKAARWLRQQGLRIRQHQARASYSLEVDGELRTVRVVADLLVEDDGERWVVEVKTGAHGRRLGFGGTRRQLLEYQLAFRTRGVLLVDPIRRSLERVVFPYGAGAAPGRPEGPAWVARLWWLAVGAGAAALVHRWW